MYGGCINHSFTYYSTSSSRVKSHGSSMMGSLLLYSKHPTSIDSARKAIITIITLIPMASPLYRPLRPIHSACATGSFLVDCLQQLFHTPTAKRGIDKGGSVIYNA